jgi:translocation and assembly module TamB
MRRAAKWIGGIILVLAALPVLLLLFANTPPGRSLLVQLTPQLTGDTVRLAGLSGRFPDALRVAHVALRDPQGDYATVDDLALDWSPLQLLHWRLVIDRLDSGHVAVLRMPVSSSSSGSTTLPQVVLHELRVARLDVAAALAGLPLALALDGSGQMLSTDHFSGSLNVRQADGDGSYTVSGSTDPRHVQAKLHVSDPEHGLIARAAGLTGLGAIGLDATLDGPRDAVAAQVKLTAGELHAQIGGTVDLERSAADLAVSAGAPAMQPRPGIGWQSVSIDAHVHGTFTRPDATGRVDIADLVAAGARVARITADVAGNAGQVRLTGQLAGLRLPAPNPDLLAAEPLTVEADARLDAPDRPLHATLRHRLFSVEANGLTGANRRVDATLRVADMQPFAAMGQVALQGGLTLNLHAATEGSATTVKADGTVGVSGGLPQAAALVGDEGKLNLAATVEAGDLTLSQLQFTGRAASLEASGRLVANQVSLAWSLAVNDLAAAQPGLGGALKASGTATGTTDDLSLVADINGKVTAQGVSSGDLTIRVEASGLPNHPAGSVVARGDLLRAPLDLAVALRQVDAGLGIDIQRASWNSLEASGAAELPTATMLPSGKLSLTIGRLADLAPLIGKPIAGRVRVALSGTATDPARPTIDAKVDAEGLELSGVGGTLRASAAGPIDALDVKLAGSSPNLQGSGMRIEAAAKVNATGRVMDLGSLQAEWRTQTLRLLAPARIGFADGVALDRLRVGLRQAVLEVSGRVGSTLDLTASLRNLPADLVGAEGTVRADARLTGTAARPTGKVSVAATGLRMHSGPGRAMPPASVTADANLAGTDAAIDVRVAAGQSRITVTGRAPLGTAGALNLRANGAVDLALLDPILAAGGRRVRGQLSLDATVGGTIAAPNVAGSARLANGDVQDFSTGLHLAGMTAHIEGSGASLRIVQFSARAGQGTISASGGIGATAPGIPLDITITARNAQPLSSDLITATLDTDLTLRGEALGQLTVGGSIHVRQADVRIPERMPAAIAVLPVNRPGAKPPAAVASVSVIALNVALDAPQQVFVRGRGLDVEFGGKMTIGGTTAAPRTVGALELRRGGISLAGRSLDFTEGRIDFNGGSIADPALHLVATSTSGNVVATLAIDGTARNPKITLSSVPALPQDEVLAHLLFGSGVGKLGALEVAEIAAALATLTGAGGGFGDPLDKVRQGLGLDRLSVRNGANGNPTLEAGRYIAPRVYLGARQGTNGGTQARVQVDIAKGLKLEATAGTGGGSATGASGESNGSSVGLTYQFEY